MKPLVSRCAAVSNRKNIAGSRCKKIPGKNGYFCDVHWNELHIDKIMATKIRGMPYVVGSTSEIYYIYSVEDKKSKVINLVKNNKKTQKKQDKKTQKKQDNRNLILPDIKSRVIDQISKTKKNIDAEADNIYINNKADVDLSDYDGVDIDSLILIAKELGIFVESKDRKEIICKIIAKENDDDKT